MLVKPLENTREGKRRFKDSAPETHLRVETHRNEVYWVVSPINTKRLKWYWNGGGKSETLHCFHIQKKSINLAK